jgi:hypothetical protein
MGAATPSSLGSATGPVVREPHESKGGASPTLGAALFASAAFFSGERALDRPWMDLDRELLPDRSRQIASADRLARDVSRLDEGQ